MSEEAAVESSEEVVEAAPQEEAAPEVPDFSTQFAALARKEKSFRATQESQKGLESKLAEMQAKLDDHESRGGLAKTNPLEFLKRNGVDIADLLHQDINGELPDETVFSNRLEMLEKQNKELHERLENEQKDASSKKEAGEWGEFVDQVTKFVDNDSKYELIRAGNMQWMVPQLMRDYFQKQNEEITAEQAADLVEESLEESLSGYFGSSKLQEKFRSAMSAQESPQEDSAGVAGEEPKKAKDRPKTLTNQLASGQTEKSTGLLSRDDSLELIARKLREGAYQ